MNRFPFIKKGLPNPNYVNDIQLFIDKKTKYLSLEIGSELYKRYEKKLKKYKKIEVRSKYYTFYNIYGHNNDSFEKMKLYFYLESDFDLTVIDELDDKDYLSRLYLSRRYSGMSHNNIENWFYFLYVSKKSKSKVNKLKKDAIDENGKIHYKKLYLLRYEYVKKKFGFRELEIYLKLLKEKYRSILKSIEKSERYKYFLKLFHKIDRKTEIVK